MGAKVHCTAHETNKTHLHTTKVIFLPDIQWAHHPDTSTSLACEKRFNKDTIGLQKSKARHGGE